MSIKTTLTEEFNDQMKDLHKLEVGTEQYSTAVNGVTKLADKIIDLEKMEIEREERIKDRDTEIELKSQQMEIDKRDKRNQNLVNVAKIAVPTVAGFAMGIISMKWEKLETITSTAGRQALKDIIRFK